MKWFDNTLGTWTILGVLFGIVLLVMMMLIALLAVIGAR